MRKLWMIWAEHVACMRQMSSLSVILEDQKGTDYLGGLSVNG
jgi:hypothetical protein